MKVYVCFPEGKAKALTMSYDDGKIQDERLVSIFNHYGIRGTFREHPKVCVHLQTDVR